MKRTERLTTQERHDIQIAVDSTVSTSPTALIGFHGAGSQ